MKGVKFLAVAFVVLFLTVGCLKPNYSKLEEEMTKLAGQYYEEQIKGKIKGFDMHEVSLEALENAGYDITMFKEKDCDLTSYSLIKLELDENREVVGDDYEIENFLKCGTYSTPKQDE